MSVDSKSLGLWLAAALAGALVAYVYAVVWGEPAAHAPGLSPWQWYWSSYGGALRRGVLLGGVAGLVLVWLLPRALGRGRR